jgi:hypothetical protein
VAPDGTLVAVFKSNRKSVAVWKIELPTKRRRLVA